MIEASKYWKLVRLDAAGASGGYKIQPMPLAQQFFQAQFLEPGERSSLPQTAVQRSLLKASQIKEMTTDRSHLSEIPHRAVAEADSQSSKQSDASSSQAELCLRCYVSYPILHTCIKQAQLFGAGNRFTYRDLLPFVLNDDGSIPLKRFIPFSVEILRSFNSERNSSLASWAELRVKRHAELNQFLLDCGLRFSSDWAVLNKANPKKLPSPDRDLVEAFHQVYRRQRSQSGSVARGRCPDPTEDQLKEMMRFLQHRHLSFPSSRELIVQLRRVAGSLRQEAVWEQRGAPLAEPLEITDSETGETIAREVPDPTSPMDVVEQQERSRLQTFCAEQFLQCLDAGIRQAIDDRVIGLQKRPRYAPLAAQVIPALRLLYFEGKSQGQIASQLGMTNQSQVSRILDLKGLLVEVRRHLLEKLLHALLQKAQELGFAEAPIQPGYLNNLMQELDSFVDETVFRDAVVELTNSKNRTMDSLYAQRIRQILVAL